MKHRIFFSYSQQQDDELIDMVFNKTKADYRKEWISKYKLQNIDYNINTMKISDFFNKEFIQFSIKDNVRSIPNIMDGLKPC